MYVTHACSPRAFFLLPVGRVNYKLQILSHAEIYPCDLHNRNMDLHRSANYYLRQQRRSIIHEMPTTSNLSAKFHVS